jgi:hypothetical protein
MSAELSISNIYKIEDNKLILDFYLINADGYIVHEFDNESDPSLKSSGLTLLINLISRYKEEFNNPLLNKYSSLSDIIALTNIEIDDLILSAECKSFNTNFDLDILDDYDHEDHPTNKDIGDGWNVYEPKNLDRKQINHLPRIEVTLVFKSKELLSGIPQGVWNFSGYDMDFDLY